MFGLARSTDLEQLRHIFGALERRLEKLETHAPAVQASLLDASDKLQRASARWERAMGRAAKASEPEGDADDQEIDELMAELHRRA